MSLKAAPCAPGGEYDIHRCCEAALLKAATFVYDCRFNALLSNQGVAEGCYRVTIDRTVSDERLRRRVLSIATALSDEANIDCGIGLDVDEQRKLPFGYRFTN